MNITSVPVTSTEEAPIVVIPATLEPAATSNVVERAMIGAAGLFSGLLNSPHMSPDLLHDWGSLIIESRSQLQVAAIRLMRETGSKERAL